MSESNTYDAIRRQILDGTAPRQVRSAAARGALPLPRAVLVQLYVALRKDADAEIRTDAESSLTAIEPPILVEVLGDAECAREVLEFFAPGAAKNEALAERIAFHRNVSAQALGDLAAEGNSKVIDLVMTNQESLLAHPELLDRLSSNPALRADQRGRILELIERAMRARARRTADQKDGNPDDAGAPTDEIVEAAELLQVDVGELFAASEIVDGEEFEHADDPEIRSAYQRIITLKTAQKVILAMRGGREERMILIRDSNKLVSLGVLRNARVTEDEVEMIARMRNVSSDVLRTIGQNREWTKSYAVITNLVGNPRTPPGVSTNFVSRMQTPHLKRLLANHDVPDLIRRMAKRTLDTRSQKTRTSIGKKR